MVADRAGPVGRASSF